MRNKRIWLLTAILVTAALVLSVGSAFARYREEFSGDFPFRAKPLNALTFAQDAWKQTENGCTLTFSMNQDEPRCRCFLAVSAGISKPEQLTVTLTLPGEEPLILLATAEPIPEVSGLSALFGSGYVFRFLDEQTQQELTLELKAETAYTLTVQGLESAAQQTSLLRLFVEYVPED